MNELYPKTYKRFFNFNSKFRKNKIEPISNYKISLNTPIDNVISLKLESIILPNSWTSFDDQLTNFSEGFKITVNNNNNIENGKDNEIDTYNENQVETIDHNCKAQKMIQRDISKLWYKLETDTDIVITLIREVTPPDDSTPTFTLSIDMHELFNIMQNDDIQSFIDYISNYTYENIKNKIIQVQNAFNINDNENAKTYIDEIYTILSNDREKEIILRNGVTNTTHVTITIDEGIYTEHELISYIEKEIEYIKSHDLKLVQYHVDNNILKAYLVEHNYNIQFEFTDLPLQVLDNRNINIITRRTSEVQHKLSLPNTYNVDDLEKYLNSNYLYLSNTTTDLKFVKVQFNDKNECTFITLDVDLNIDVYITIDTKNTANLSISGNFDGNSIIETLNNQLDNLPIVFQIDSSTLRTSFSLDVSNENVESVDIQLWPANATIETKRNTLAYYLGFRDTDDLNFDGIVTLTKTNSTMTSSSIFDSTSDKYVFFLLNENGVTGTSDTYTAFLDKEILGPSKILAKINLYEGTFGINIQESSSVQLSKQRYYRPPIQITDFNVSIVNENGIPIEMNGMDYSFTLELEFAFSNIQR